MWLDREQHRQLQAEDMSAGLMDDFDRQAAEIARPYQARALERDIMARYEEGASVAAGEGLLRGAMDAFDRGAQELRGRWAELGRNLTVRDPGRGEKIVGAVGDVAGRVGEAMGRGGVARAGGAAGEAAGEIAGELYKTSPGGRALGQMGIGPVETEEEALEKMRGGWLIGADEEMLRERFRQLNQREPTESELAREVMLQESMESLAIGGGEPLKPHKPAKRPVGAREIPFGDLEEGLPAGGEPGAPPLGAGEAPPVVPPGRPPAPPEMPGKQPWEMTKAEYDASPYARDLSYDIAYQGWLDEGRRPAPTYGKEPWQMSRDEYQAAEARGMMGNVGKRSGRELNDALDRYGRDAYRRMTVETALREGKPVPPDVLADYPDLAGTPPPPKQPPAPPTPPPGPPTAPPPPATLPREASRDFMSGKPGTYIGYRGGLPGGQGNVNMMGGTWVAQNADYADKFAASMPGAIRQQVQISVRRPLVLQREGDAQILAELMIRANKEPEESIAEFARAIRENGISHLDRRSAAAVRAAGYDAVVSDVDLGSAHTSGPVMLALEPSAVTGVGKLASAAPPSGMEPPPGGLPPQAAGRALVPAGAPPGPPTAPPPGGLVPTAPGGLVPTGKPPIPAPGGAGGAIPPGAGAPPAGPGLPPPGGFPPPGAGAAAGGTPGQGASAYNRLRAMYSGRRSPLVQTVQQRLDALGREFVRAWTDRGTDLARVQEAGTRAAGGNLPPEEMAAYLARMNTDKAAAVKLRDGFSPILQAARDAGVDQADLSIYLTNRHTIDVAAATGNPNRTFSGGLTAADAQAAINHQAQLLGTGKFAELEIAAGRTADFVRQSWDTLLDAGVITQQLHDEMVRRYPYYIPTKILKYMDKPGDPNMLARGASISLSDSGVRRFTLEGTDAAREDPLGSVIGYTHQAERIAAKNEAFNAFIGLRDRLGIQQIIPEVTGNAAHHLQPDEVYLHGFTDGNYRTFVVPRDVEEAIGRVTRLPRLEWLEVPMMLFKAGATSRNPAFLASNSFLDAFTYMARASIREGGPQHAPRVMLELAKGYREAFRGMTAGRYEGRLNELYRRGGGMFGMYQTTPEGRMQTVRELTRRGTFEVKSKGDVLRMLKDIATLKPVEAVGERIEMAPRVAQYNLALARGKQPLEAMIEARTVTIDFEQGGYISKFLNQVIPFFNVDVQSKTQIVRAIREDWRAALATGISMLAVPTVMAEAWNNADPQRKRDYEDVPDYIKSQGIVFMLPGEAPVDERGDRRPPVFIIRAREHTPVVIITREATRRALGEDPQSWQEFLGSIITSTSPVQGAGMGEVAANLAPLGIGTAAQLYANRDPFTGRMISTKRRDVTASAASKAIAGGLGAVSRATGIGDEPTPSQVEFAIRDLGTGLAGAALAASNLVAGQKGTGRLSEAPVVGGVAGRVIKSEIGARLEKSREAVLSRETRQLLKEHGVDLGLGPSGNTLLGVPLTIQEQADYQQAINEGVESDLRWLIALPQWASMSPELRKRAVDQVVDAVRQRSRARVLGGLGQAEMGRRAVSGSAGR